ncbi:MAG: hypothetical protein IPP27_12080 [Bacteroidetes bacterium]|nr:hypothetical protein [Bacteroidota bacterium]
MGIIYLRFILSHLPELQNQWQGIGNRVSGNACHMQFSKSGSRFLFSTNAGLIEFFDFDRCTGIFSNAIVISGIRGGGSAIT